MPYKLQMFEELANERKPNFYNDDEVRARLEIIARYKSQTLINKPNEKVNYYNPIVRSSNRILSNASSISEAFRRAKNKFKRQKGKSRSS